MSDPNNASAEPNTLPIAGAEAPAAVTPPEGTTEKPLYTGLIGDIKDTNQAVDYIKVLEEKLTAATLAAQNRSQLSGNQPVTPPTAPTRDIRDEIEEELFTNPKQALAKFEQHILAGVQQINSNENLRKKFWDDFYLENPDLKGQERIVQLTERDKSDELKPLSFSEARKKLAAETRRNIDLVKSKTGVRETEIPSRSATITGSSNSPASAGGTGATAQTNFIDQIRSFQRSRGK